MIMSADVVWGGSREELGWVLETYKQKNAKDKYKNASLKEKKGNTLLYKSSTIRS